MKQHKLIGIIKRWAAFIFIALMISGCAVFGKSLEAPRITLSNLTAQESTGFESVFQIQIRVMNPNDIDLNIQGVDCKLDINDKPFAYGLSQAKVTVPAYGSATMPMTLYSSIFDIARGILDVSITKEMTYRLKGRVRLDGTVRLPSKLKFKSEGTFPLKDLQDLTLPEQF